MIENAPAQSLPVAALIGDAVVMVPADATVHRAARSLTEAQVGALVVGGPDEVLAVVSERDVVHAVAAGRDPATTTALDIGTTRLVWCDVTATVGEVAAEMAEQYIRHVLVEEDGRLVGMVSSRDVLGVYAAADDAETAGSI